MQLSYADIKKVTDIATKFAIADGVITHVLPIESGRINTTFKIVVSSGEDTTSYMLQRVNTYVFSSATKVMENAVAITNHLRKNGLETLEFVMTKDGSPLYEDGNDVYRMTKFIHAEVFQAVTRPRDMYMLGAAIGLFALGLNDFDVKSLHVTIPDFHNTHVRFDNCILSALKNARVTDGERVKKSSEELNYVIENKDLTFAIVYSLVDGEIPTRVTHNDPKLNNVLFDRKSNNPRCMIDLDTVMPGSTLYDLADAIRYSANTASEEETDITKVSLDLDLLKACLEGFNAIAPNFLNKAEIAMLPLAIKLMPLELGMRFLTDYYDGDVYFKVSRPDQNLNRARVQLALAKDIDMKMSNIFDIVKSVF